MQWLSTIQNEFVCVCVCVKWLNNSLISLEKPASILEWRPHSFQKWLNMTWFWIFLEFSNRNFGWYSHKFHQIFRVKSTQPSEFAKNLRNLAYIFIVPAHSIWPKKIDEIRYQNGIIEKFIGILLKECRNWNVRSCPTYLLELYTVYKKRDTILKAQYFRSSYWIEQFEVCNNFTIIFVLVSMPFFISFNLNSLIRDCIYTKSSIRIWNVF